MKSKIIQCNNLPDYIFRKVSQNINDGIFCVTMQGDGMKDVNIHDGDLLFVQQQVMVENGEIGVALVDETWVIGQVFYFPEKKLLLLHSANTKYEDLAFEGEEAEEVVFLGKVMACLTDPLRERHKAKRDKASLPFPS